MVLLFTPNVQFWGVYASAVGLAEAAQPVVGRINVIQLVDCTPGCGRERNLPTG